jgi:hypothetical protein
VFETVRLLTLYGEGGILTNGVAGKLDKRVEKPFDADSPNAVIRGF